jgi:hypothetical protein
MSLQKSGTNNRLPILDCPSDVDTHFIKLTKYFKIINNCVSEYYDRHMYKLTFYLEIYKIICEDSLNPNSETITAPTTAVIPQIAVTASNMDNIRFDAAPPNTTSDAAPPNTTSDAAPPNMDNVFLSDSENINKHITEIKKILESGRINTHKRKNLTLHFKKLFELLKLTTLQACTPMMSLQMEKYRTLLNETIEYFNLGINDPRDIERRNVVHFCNTRHSN